MLFSESNRVFVSWSSEIGLGEYGGAFFPSESATRIDKFNVNYFLTVPWINRKIDLVDPTILDRQPEARYDLICVAGYTQSDSEHVRVNA